MSDSASRDKGEVKEKRWELEKTFAELGILRKFFFFADKIGRLFMSDHIADHNQRKVR